jgi:hypothetical protein
MNLSERRKAALDKCSIVTNREYTKYLQATESAREEYFAELKRLDEEAEAALRRLPESPKVDAP